MNQDFKDICNDLINIYNKIFNENYNTSEIADMP